MKRVKRENLSEKPTHESAKKAKVNQDRVAKSVSAKRATKSGTTTVKQKLAVRINAKRNCKSESSKVKIQVPLTKKKSKVWRWWEKATPVDDRVWRKLEHNGPVFAPPYEPVPKKVKFYYGSKHVSLSKPTEEVAGFYGRMLDHDYTSKPVFNKNFFEDWRSVMTPLERKVIGDLSKCNFKDFDAYYKEMSEERKKMTREQKVAIKRENEKLEEKYGYCRVDGHRQKIGNYKIEPPGLFRGRGKHPKMGRLKKRIEAEDIVINIGREAKVPKPPSGHRWKEVRHDNKVSWLAKWTENVLGSTKYIMLNQSSKLKAEKDLKKFELARKLNVHADRIRVVYRSDFKSNDMKVKQRGVALYFIDKLALRAGSEKEEGTVDTVGCCSLRVEHITLRDKLDGEECVVCFDFPGKDSIRYKNTVPVDKRAYKNLKLFVEGKRRGEKLFDRLNTVILNKHLNDLMEGLTAKVFRTYNASKIFQEQLDATTRKHMPVDEKLLEYNRANRTVAIVCNHQRAVPKGFAQSMRNLKAKIKAKGSRIAECERDLKSSAKCKTDAEKKKLEGKKKKVIQLREQLRKLEVQVVDKEENKQIALGTSKLNYLDPRISVAWCRKWEVPLEKVYNKTQRDKFRWAIEMTGLKYRF